MKYKIILICFLFSFNTFSNEKWIEKVKLLGVIKIDDNFYVDQYETTNFNWSEYLYWTERIFGEESAEYKSTIPNTHIWLEELKCLHILGVDDYYLRSSQYQNYPVVGITQKQALDYCKWRSDRVFEYLLIRYKIISTNFNQSKDNYFSIENYFQGKYNNTPPNKNIKYYPKYYLPSENQWKFVIEYQNHKNSLNKKYVTKNQLDVKTCNNDSLIKDPMVNVDFWVWKNEIAHLNDNISEWLIESNKAIGANWKDTFNIKKSIVREFEKETTTVGFRAICTWVKYEEK